LPRIKLAIPHAAVTISGRLPAKPIIALARIPGVQVIANPPDMDRIIQSAHVYVAPTRVGSGLKLRLKDGFRLGLPIVSHAISAKGYRDVFPKPLLQTFTTADECVSALVKLYRNDICATDRLDIQRRYVDQYSFNSGVVRLRRILAAHGLVESNL